jgi:hypothetical protein
MAVASRPRLLDALNGLACSLLDPLEGDGCVISRLLGDVLLPTCETSRDGRRLAYGQGYLASEFPETQAVLVEGAPRAVCAADPVCEPGEARLLEALGYSALLMLRLELGGEAWGLVEVYREESRPFGPAEIRAGSLRLAEFARP